MPQSLVGSYSIATADHRYYDLEFQIPDNCEYTLSGSAGVFIIAVQLEKGQTQPSSTFVKYTETLLSSGGIIKIDFEQNCENIMTTKPKIRVEYI